MSVEMISAVFTGLSGLLAALSLLLANRSRRVGEDSKVYRRLVRTTQKKLIAALLHMNLLEQRLADAGRPVPDRPEILEQDDDDEGPEPAPARANARA